MLRLILGWFIVVLGGMVVDSARVVQAQASVPDTGSLPDSALVIPWMETSFAPYTFPEECAAARVWWERRYWRDHRPDTVYVGPNGSSDQPTTQQAILQCASRFPLAQVESREALLGLARVGLVSGHIARADSALTQLMQRMKTASVTIQAWADYEAVDLYLNAPIPQVASAMRYLVRLDALGPPATVRRLDAHLEMAAEARRRDSVVLWAQEVQAAMRASQDLATSERITHLRAMAKVYLISAQLEARQNDAAAARALLATGRALAVSVPPDPLKPEEKGVIVRWFDHAATWYAPQGQSAPPVQATQWANAGPAGTIHPRPGQPALLAFVSVNCGGACYDDYGVLRRLTTKYPASQLETILVTQTEGYVHTQQFFVSPDSEMSRTEAYFLHTLQLPGVALAMWHTTFDKRDDDALIPQPAPAGTAYHLPVGYPYEPPPTPAPLSHPWSHITVCVVDKHGVIRYYTDLARMNEMVLDDILESLM